MQPVKKILDKLDGLHYRQDYLCLAKETYEQSLQVYLTDGNRIIKNITNEHLFVGYNPLIFAFPSFPDLGLTASIQLVFSQRILHLNELFVKKDALALLDLKIIHKKNMANHSILYYEGVNGSHSFLSRFHQFINRINNQLYNKRSGNVFLHDNLHKQVQIAYAIPRNISLITTGNDEQFNLFPTDLHGQVDEAHYIISLRSGGKACEQVDAAGRVLISQVHPGTYKTVYSLGKNHMQPLKPKDNFPFSQSVSEKFKWPLPEQAVSYNELILQDSFIHGIHKIFLFKITHHHSLQAETATLAHIHNSYASWRYKNKLPGNYLFR